MIIINTKQVEKKRKKKKSLVYGITANGNK